MLDWDLNPHLRISEFKCTTTVEDGLSEVGGVPGRWDDGPRSTMCQERTLDSILYLLCVENWLNIGPRSQTPWVQIPTPPLTSCRTWTP